LFLSNSITSICYDPILSFISTKRIPPAIAMMEPSTDGKPPAYGAIRLSDRRMNEIERAWTAELENDDWCHCKQKCSKKYCVKIANMWFGFQPEILQSKTVKRLVRDRQSQPAWRAVLQIHGRNVARFMRQGFKVKLNNFVIGGSRIDLDCKEYIAPGQLPAGLTMEDLLTSKFAPAWGWNLKGTSWNHRRRYNLFDREQPANWAGRLMVFGKQPSTVINFDPKSLNLSSEVWGWARNWKGETMFDTRRGPSASYNLIFPGVFSWCEWPGDQEQATLERSTEGGKKERRVEEER
jgi:hypothetical protein